MPRWTDTPPTNGAPHANRIRRTPATKPLAAIVTSPDLTGCNTHFIANRTVPCEGEETCPHCAEGHSWRWHGYVAAIETGTLEHFIFECTAAAADSFRNYLTVHGNLRGCHFTASRPNGRANGRVVIACRRIDEQRNRLPAPLNVRKILCHIWSVQYTDVHPRATLVENIGRLDVHDSGKDGRYRT